MPRDVDDSQDESIGGLATSMFQGEYAPIAASESDVQSAPSGTGRRVRLGVAAVLTGAVVLSAALYCRRPSHGFLSGDASALSQLNGAGSSSASANATSTSSHGNAVPFRYMPVNGKALFPRVKPQLGASRNVDAELQPNDVFWVDGVVQNKQTHILFANIHGGKGYVPLWIPHLGEMARRISLAEAMNAGGSQGSTGAGSGSSQQVADPAAASLASQVKKVTTGAPPPPTATTTTTPGVCHDEPKGWADKDDSKCSDYANYCQMDGTPNSKWDPTWGTFKDNVDPQMPGKSFGKSASEACCACGGGSIPATATTSVTLSGGLPGIPVAGQSTMGTTVVPTTNTTTLPTTSTTTVATTVANTTTTLPIALTTTVANTTAAVPTTLTTTVANTTAAVPTTLTTTVANTTAAVPTTLTTTIANTTAAVTTTLTTTEEADATTTEEEEEDANATTSTSEEADSGDDDDNEEEEDANATTSTSEEADSGDDDDNEEEGAEDYDTSTSTTEASDDSSNEANSTEEASDEGEEGTTSTEDEDTNTTEAPAEVDVSSDTSTTTASSAAAVEAAQDTGCVGCVLPGETCIALAGSPTMTGEECEQYGGVWTA
eukprot:TRINITY_DN1622_c0_g1_i1.p1 TRINITY_DN1622_c0_g1~~TRINITY_DN1622_c0_g1_i1.p1  ORF type:complete len:604 (-),score=105.24 TRINITY_DN1622_c0_g1_i1:341-2152(-)